MKKIFVAYADGNLAYSLKRIGRQARSLGFFEEVRLFTPDSLPPYIKQSPLMQYRRGGGYWCWKPAIIWETLKESDEGDIVVYVDAGCTLKNMPEWTLYFELLKRYDTICFQYRDIMPEWEQWGQASTQIKYWTKKTCLDFFDNLMGTQQYHSFNKVLATVLMCKGKQNEFVRKWLEITLEHPELITDPSAQERKEQPEGFAFHKHDQSIITPLAYYFRDSVMVMPELCETCGANVAIRATRIRCRNFKSFLFERFKYNLMHLMGMKVYNKVKNAVIRK